MKSTKETGPVESSHTPFFAQVQKDVHQLSTGSLVAILLGCIVLALMLVLAPQLLLAFLLAGLVIGLTTISPYAGLLILISFIFMRPAERFPALEALHLVRLQALLLVGIWLLSRHMHRKEGLISHPVIKAFGFGTIIIGISAITALWRQPAFTLFADQLFYLLLLVVMADVVNSESRLRGYLVTLLSLAVFLSVEQLLRYNEFAVNTGVARARGIGTALGDSNDFGLAMLFFLPFAIFGSLFASNRFVKIVSAIVTILLVASLVATGSRGAVVGFAVLCFALWTKSQRKLLVGLGLLAALITIWLLASASYRERVSSILTYQQEETATVRRNAWKAGFDMFLSRPLFGVGAKNFPVAYFGDTGIVDAPSQWRAAHSLYFEALAELGAVGIVWLFVFIGLIISSARRAQRRLRESRHPPGIAWIAAYGVEISLYSYLAAGAFLSCLYYPYFWFLAGIAVVIDVATKELSTDINYSEEGGQHTDMLEPALTS